MEVTNNLKKLFKNVIFDIVLFLTIGFFLLATIGGVYSIIVGSIEGGIVVIGFGIMALMLLVFFVLAMIRNKQNSARFSTAVFWLTYLPSVAIVMFMVFVTVFSFAENLTLLSFIFMIPAVPVAFYGFYGGFIYSGKAWPDWFCITIRIIAVAAYAIVAALFVKAAAGILVISFILIAFSHNDFIFQYTPIFIIANLFVTLIIGFLMRGDESLFVSLVVAPLVITTILSIPFLAAILDAFRVRKKRVVDSATDPYKALKLIKEDYDWGLISEEEYKKNRAFFMSQI